LLFPELRTPRLTLRSSEPSDLEAVFKGLSDPAVIAYYGVAYKSKQEAKVQLDWYEYVWQNDEGIYWMLTESATGRFLGTVGLYHWMQPNRKAELGFWLNPAEWRKGYMTEALSPVLRYGFDTMDLNRMEALVEEGNTPAAALLKKTGFAHEGTMRNCELKEADDVFISLQLYGLLRQEYDA
jgi:[ribosomal protein S5]-alanine N-acetyltransferase